MATISKWDALLEQKPVPIIDKLVEDLAKLFAAELSAWPPRIEALSEESPRAFPFDPETPAPTPIEWRESFRLVRFELERNLEAFDDYVRNRRWQAAEIPDARKPVLLFLTQLVLEHLLALGEATEGRINRKRMLDVAERVERALQQPSVVPR